MNYVVNNKNFSTAQIYFWKLLTKIKINAILVIYFDTLSEIVKKLMAISAYVFFMSDYIQLSRLVSAVCHSGQ